jgi:hypothetical protein
MSTIPAGLAGRKLERYLYRDCVLLALAVSYRTGWPVVQLFEAPDGPLAAMNDKRDPDQWTVRHALVRMPDGRLLDAAGSHDDYSGEEPFSFADWEMDGAETFPRELLHDADELLEAIGELS